MLYPIGIQNFEKLRDGDYIYVDKTDKLYNLVNQGGYYFLSRPRRFGKSLLVSTLEAYLQGKKELFKGLAIESLEKNWTEYPVLHIDLSGVTYDEEEVLPKVLGQKLSEWETAYGVTGTADIIGLRFQSVIKAAYEKTGRPVVILIDEYDKPLIDNLDSPDLQEYYRKTLQGFYSVLKAMDGCIKFGFLTGVTKIGKLSVFSGLNNLRDISMLPQYADICGISEKDLHSCFSESIRELAAANSLTEEQCYAKLAEMYDGYHFCEDSVGMYNPFSLLNTFASNKFREYWFETGTPTFLVKLLKQTDYDIRRIADDDVEIDVDMISGVNDYINDPIPVLYQSGYLTIRSFDEMFGIYRLGFPNMEVRKGFMKMLLACYVPVREKEGNVLISKLYRAVTEGKPEDMMLLLESLFARANYQIQGDAEKDFQYAMYIIFELLGEYVQTEKQTSNGRIDILLQTKDYVYIMEIKTDFSADAAIQQIDEKGYDRPFATDSRRLFRIGVSFSKENRRIEEWKII